MPFRDRAGLDLAGPPYEARHAPAAFPVGVLLAVERRVGAVRPGVVLGTVVGRVHDDRVVGDAELVELVEHLADLLVVRDHAIAVVVLSALAAVLRGQVRPEVHRRRVVPEEEGLVRLGLLLHPPDRGRRDLLVDGLHALLGQRAGVLDRLLADSAPAGISRRVILVGRHAMQHAAGSKSLLECRILGIVRQFWFFFGVQVIEVAEELVEAVHGRQVFIPIAEMVLAELSGGVAERLQHFGDRRIFFLKSDRGAGHADFGQAGTNRILAGDEAGTASGAALLAVPVGERRAFFADAVDVGRLVAHHAHAVAADVPHADVVAPENQDVRFLRSHRGLSSQLRHEIERAP